MSACLGGNEKTGNVHVAPSLHFLYGILHFICNCLTDAMESLVLNKNYMVCMCISGLGVGGFCCKISIASTGR